jgi:serine/threonine protein kinase/Tfp pilus assembly protein PilF
MSESINFSDLADFGPIANDQARCRCGSLARVASGLCVSCLLRSGLDANETEAEDFEALIAEVNIPDRDWQLGNYRILEEIGRGGMGVIYRARHTPSRRVVALKRVLNYHSDSQETLSRFQREARAAASLDHPNILPIFDVGATEDGLPFFTMKFAARGSLLNARESFRDSPRQAARLIATVARAVDYAHGQGILHRDLKPGNILLDARGEPMVSDFGLAKWLDNETELTGTLTVFGTPGYIAPEQVANATATLAPSTDVYSLGAILFELLSGRPPFLGEHAMAVLRQAEGNEAPKLSSIVPKASRDLETICARCLERDALLRYQSAADLAQDLEQWLEGRPIAARPISIAGRLYRWARRNPLLAGSVGICLLLVAVLTTRQIQNWNLDTKVRQNELARNSVAVLPLLDLDHATEDVNWTSKFAHDLQSGLSRMGNARVIPSKNQSGNENTTSSTARTTLFSTRRQTRNGIRFSMQLLERDGETLFGKVVDLNTNDAGRNNFARDLAPQIFSILSANDWSSVLAPKRDAGMQNQQARELMTAGQELISHLTVRDLNLAISCFEKALKIEPRSGLAHARLASALAIRTYYSNDANILAYATREGEEASRLAPDSAEVRRILAGVKYQQGRYREALEDALFAVESGAPNARSFGLVGMLSREIGRPDQALRWFDLASRFGATPGEYDCSIGDCWAALGDFDKAGACYQRANDLHPDRSNGLRGMSRLYLLSADFAQARSLYRQTVTLSPDGTENAQLGAQIEFFARNFPEAQKIYTILQRNDPNGGGEFYGAISYKSALGRIAQNGKTSDRGYSLLKECLAHEQNQLATAPSNPAVLYRIAAIESSLGEIESALAHLDAAVAAGWTDHRSLSLDPRFDRLSDDTRFQAILGRLLLKIDDLRKQIVP